MRLRPKISQHDLEFKTRLIEDFLKEGDKVKGDRDLPWSGDYSCRHRAFYPPKRSLPASGDAGLVERAPLMEGKNLS